MTLSVRTAQEPTRHAIGLALYIPARSKVGGPATLLLLVNQALAFGTNLCRPWLSVVAYPFLMSLVNMKCLLHLWSPHLLLLTQGTATRSFLLHTQPSINVSTAGPPMDLSAIPPKSLQKAILHSGRSCAEYEPC